jgi:tRNA threonylcarbamoyl adenosine modification protein (Sua5/YciO/YrdC/YwlC family)
VKELVLALEQGLVVAAATESSFGLLADATSKRALDRLLAVKPRGADKGIPIILPDETSWSLLVPEVPAGALALAREFWPGAFSIALRAYPSLDSRLTLDGSVAVRLPGASLAADLARAFGKPLTATSANLPGDPPANSDAEVLAALGSAALRGDLVVAPGQSPGGPPSTLVLLEAERARLVREGRVPLARVREVLAQARVHLDEQGGGR